MSLYVLKQYGSDLVPYDKTCIIHGIYSKEEALDIIIDIICSLKKANYDYTFDLSHEDLFSSVYYNGNSFYYGYIQFCLDEYVVL